MTQPNPDTPSFEKRVSQYVALRDKIKAIETKHDEEIKRFKETLEKLNGALLAHLNQIGGNGVMTAYGTVSKTTKKSATIADVSAFWTYVVSQGDFDFIDKKANVKRVEEFINDTENNPQGLPPPGITFTQVDKVNVKRKTGT